MARVEPATKKQLEFLRALGVEFPPAVTKADATRLITAATFKVPATAKQLEYLAALCVPVADLQPILKAEVDALIEEAFAARDYACQLFDEEFKPERGANGQFVKGSLKGVTAEFAQRQTDRMLRFILADRDRRKAVRKMIESGALRHGIPPDELRASVLAIVAAPSELRAITRPAESFFVKLFGWLIGK